MSSLSVIENIIEWHQIESLHVSDILIYGMACQSGLRRGYCLNYSYLHLVDSKRSLLNTNLNDM